MDSKELQKKFSDNVRNGCEGDFPEVNGKTFAIYHKHLKKKLSRLLGFVFTLTQEAIGADLWEKCILQFLASQSVSGESVLGLSHAFYTYLKDKCKEIQYPFLEELVNFEYLLVELFYLEDIPPLPFQPVGNRLESAVVFNPEHRFLALDYPVFKYEGPDLAQRKGSYYLLLYRHPTLFTVEIIELSALYFSALSMMAEQSVSLLAAIERAARELGIPKEEINPEQMFNFFDSLQEQRVILGFQ